MVRAVGVDLLLLQFGPLAGRDIDHHPARAVNFLGHQEGGLDRVAEDVAQHFDDVFVGVVVVVEEDHLPGTGGVDLWGDEGLGDGHGKGLGHLTPQPRQGFVARVLGQAVAVQGQDVDAVPVTFVGDCAFQAMTPLAHAGLTGHGIDQ